MNQELEKLIKKCVQEIGDEAFKKEIKKILNQKKEKETLTIIVNEGIHPNSPIHNRGEIYIASRGNIDFSSKENIEQEFSIILHGVAEKLKSKPWKKVYLVPFGPAVLSMQVKLLVYRILYIETIDFLYTGNGNYYDLNLNLRMIAANS